MVEILRQEQGIIASLPSEIVRAGVNAETGHRSQITSPDSLCVTMGKPTNRALFT